MTLAGHIDMFIQLALGGQLGAEFRLADVRAWLSQQGLAVDAGEALSAHRESPNTRVYTTERIGLGPNSYYRVVEKPKGVLSSSVRRMHEQQAREMAGRWQQEYVNRMSPVLSRSARARSVFTQAEAEIQAVATILGVRIAALEHEDEDEQ